MAQKQFTNLYAFIIVLIIFAGFMTYLVEAGNELLGNSNARLDNDSREYIAQLNGTNLSDFDSTTRKNVEDPILSNLNISQGNPKDFALEFQFAKEKGSKIELFARSIFLMPGVILYDLMRLDRGAWGKLVVILNGFWVLALIIATIYFARGVVT